MSKLLLCPFCGSKPVWSCGSLACDGCGATYGARETYEETEIGWNKRIAEKNIHNKAIEDCAHFIEMLSSGVCPVTGKIFGTDDNHARWAADIRRRKI